MPHLSIDIETYSSYDLKDVGVHKYVEAPDFEIMLFGYSFNGEPAQVVDLASGETIPAHIARALEDPEVELRAFNATFERVCIDKFFMFDGTGPGDPARWRCTMVHAAMVGLPLDLDTAAKVIQIADKKDAAGKALIKLFCTPCKPTAKNGNRTRNLPEHAPEKWAQFIEYCRQDVVVEMAVKNWVSFYPVSDFEQHLYTMDQQMNDRGVFLDMQLVKYAAELGERHKDNLMQEAAEITGLQNPNSRDQLKRWIEEQTGEAVESVTKDAVSDMLKNISDDVVKRMLEIRQEANKTSASKYGRMATSVCSDNRYRGLIQIYGANRTGRDAGRGVQIQNLPKIKEWVLQELDTLRAVVKTGDLDTLIALYAPGSGKGDFASIPSLLSQLIRTAVVAAPGKKFIVSDFKAIEARVIAWLAGEEWVLEVFRTHGLIYEAAASRMFNIPIELIKKGSPEREKGKVGTLALGFQGGPQALIQMGALNSGLTEDELPLIVDAWRKANPKIVQFWYDLQKAAIACVETGQRQTVRGCVKFSYYKDTMFITLPSGRKLSYVRPRVKIGKFDRPALSYEGLDQEKKIWRRMDTYGGKLAENIVQAVARDCMMYAYTALEAEGYTMVMRVHDELVAEVPEDFGSVEDMEEIMSRPIPWAEGLPLASEGFQSLYYKK